MLRFRNAALFVLGAVLLLGAGSCPNPNPPTPPTPTPPIPPGPVHSEMILTASGTKLLVGTEQFHMRGCSFCCMDSPVKSGWPMASEEGLSWLKALGDCNLVELRPGPFLSSSETWMKKKGKVPFREGRPDQGVYVEVAGKADLTKFNPEFEKRLNAILEYGAQEGIWFVLDAVDAWRCKHEQAGDDVGHPWHPAKNIQGEDALSTCWRAEITTGTQEQYLRWLFGIALRYGNVIVQDGNEPDQVTGSSMGKMQWSLSTRNIMRAVEQEKGYPRHLFITNFSDEGFPEAAQIDGVSLHANFAEPVANKPTFNNENNPYPPWTADMWQAVRCQSEATGAWFWMWRHEQDQGTFEASLAKMREGCEGVPIDPCPFPVPQTAYVYCKPHGPWEEGTRFDCTPQRAIAPLGGQPVWPEDVFRPACETKSAGGYPSFSISDMSGSLVLSPLGNPWQFKLSGLGSAILHCSVPARPGVELCGYAVQLP